MSTRQKVAILICSRKGGHKFPALALTQYLESKYANVVKPEFINLLDHLPMVNFFDGLGRWGDLHLPQLWRKGYANLHKGNALYTTLFRKSLALVLANRDARRRILNAIGKPSLIISFQPEVNCLGKWLKVWFAAPLQTMVMDYSAHLGWVDQAIDYYYVANQFVYEQLVGYGVPREKIAITGAPSQPGFEEVLQNSVKSQRQKLNLKEDIPTILIMSGYLGKMLDYPGIVSALLKLEIPIQILVVVGKNYAMYQKLQEIKNDDLHLFYNVPSIHPVMWAADIVISKPGGMVIADALTLGKPMVLIDPRAGSLQEIIFADYIEKQGAGVHVKDASEAVAAVNMLINQPARLGAMAKMAYDLGLKNRTAAQVIAEHIVQSLK